MNSRKQVLVCAYSSFQTRKLLSQNCKIVVCVATRCTRSFVNASGAKNNQPQRIYELLNVAKSIRGERGTYSGSSSHSESSRWASAAAAATFTVAVGMGLWQRSNDPIRLDAADAAPSPDELKKAPAPGKVEGLPLYTRYFFIM